MAIYIKEKEIKQREIGDGLEVKRNFLRRTAAQVPIAVDWTCFSTPWDTENTLTVLYATYSRIDQLFIVIPKPPSPSSSPELDPFSGEGRPFRIFKPAPDLQNLVYQCQDVHWSYVKDRIYRMLLGKDDSTLDEDDDFGNKDFWTSLYTTVMMAGGIDACRDRKGEGEGEGEDFCLKKGGESIRCKLPRISVQELSGYPEDMVELTPVPSLTRDHQLRLENEATAAANAAAGVSNPEETERLLEEDPFTTLSVRDEDDKETTDNDAEYNTNNENNAGDDDHEVEGQDVYDNGVAEKRESVCQQQQDQISVSRYLPDVYCGNTVIWN